MQQQSSSSDSATIAIPPTLLIPPLAVDHLAVITKLDKLQRLFSSSIKNAYYKRTQLFPELLDRVSKKTECGSGNSYMKIDISTCIPWKYLTDPNANIAWDANFLHLFSLTIRYHLYEASVVLFSSMMETTLAKWELQISVLHLFMTTSCYLATGMMMVLKKHKPGVEDMILRLVLQKFTLHNVRFCELQSWFACLFNFFAPFTSIREMISSTPSFREKKIQLIIEIGNHLLLTRSCSVYRFDHEEESILLSWIFQLMFLYIHKDWIARQLWWCHHFFGHISSMITNHDMYIGTFISLLEDVQAKIYGSFQLVLPEHGSLPQLPVIQSFQKQQQREIHHLNEQLLASAPPELSVVMQMLSSEYTQPGTRLNLVLMFGNHQTGENGHDADASSHKNALLEQVVQEVERNRCAHYWLHRSKQICVSDCHSSFRVGRRTGDNEKDCYSYLTSVSTYPEMHVFSSMFENTKSKGQVNVQMDFASPSIRAQRLVRTSPFEISYISGTFTENFLTQTFDLVVQKHKQDIPTTVSLLNALFHQVYMPTKWCKHVTLRFLIHLTSNKTWWQEVYNSREDIDTLVNLWIQWFRACSYNLNTLVSRRLTDLQLLIVSAPFLHSDQKKKMVEAMLVSMEFQELFLFETVELYDFKHLLTLLLGSIAHNEVQLIRLFFSLTVERFVQLVSMKLYDWLDMYTQLEDDEATMSSTSKCMDAPPVFDSFPLFSAFAQKCVMLMEVPDWKEPCFTKDDVYEKETVIRQRRLSRSFTTVENTTKEEEKEGVRIREIAKVSKVRVQQMLRKYKSPPPPVDSSNQEIAVEVAADLEESYETDVLLYRFLVGMANSTFMRAILEMTQHKASGGAMYFLKWQPSLLNLMHPQQVSWFWKRCTELKNDSVLRNDIYRLLIQRFDYLYADHSRHSLLSSMVSKIRPLVRWKLRDAQLKALTEFLTRYPSTMELHTITSLSRFQAFFPQRPLFEDLTKPVCDCSICFDTIDCRKSLAVFTSCGHFYCISCCLRAFFRWQGPLQEFVQNEEEHEEELTAASTPISSRQAITWVSAKSKEQCICPFCRMSVNSPQPSLPGCFNTFMMIESLKQGPWTLSTQQVRKFILPVLYLLDFPSIPSPINHTAGLSQRRKRKRTN